MDEDTNSSPVTVMVPWDHPDRELRLMIAIKALMSRLDLKPADLGRVFEYFRARARYESLDNDTIDF